MDENNVILQNEDFVFLNTQKDVQTIVRPSTSFWQDVFRRLRQNKIAMFGLLIITTMVVLSIVMPMISPHEYSTNDLQNINLPPRETHRYGTDT